MSATDGHVDRWRKRRTDGRTPADSYSNAYA